MNDIKNIIANQLRLVLESGTIRNLLEGMADHALNSQREDYEPCLNFNQTRATLETVALFAKIVIDNDTKIEVAKMSDIQKEEEPESIKKGIRMPNGVLISMKDLKYRRFDNESD